MTQFTRLCCYFPILDQPCFARTPEELKRQFLKHKGVRCSRALSLSERSFLCVPIQVFFFPTNRTESQKASGSAVEAKVIVYMEDKQDTAHAYS